jgi:SepF-like predicted cell division protein (DUF552 family)
MLAINYITFHRYFGRVILLHKLIKIHFKCKHSLKIPAVRTMLLPALYYLMGLFDNLFGGSKRNVQDYISLSSDDLDMTAVKESFQVHIAEIRDIEDVIAVKDLVYGGGIVIADITRLRTKDSVMNRITNELKQVVAEVGGDIVQKGDDQIIATPSGVSINRDKIGRSR